jgi:hypothetical protein
MRGAGAAEARRGRRSSRRRRRGHKEEERRENSIVVCTTPLYCYILLRILIQYCTVYCIEAVFRDSGV